MQLSVQGTEKSSSWMQNIRNLCCLSQNVDCVSFNLVKTSKMYVMFLKKSVFDFMFFDVQVIKADFMSEAAIKCCLDSEIILVASVFER